MTVHLNHVIRFTFSQCQWCNRLKCSVTKIVSVFCVWLLFEFIKKNNAFNHNTCTQVFFIKLLFLLFSLTLFRYYFLYSTIFCRFSTFNRFPAILYYFPLFFVALHSQTISQNSLLFSAIFLSFLTFNRFSTIILPDFSHSFAP